MRWLPSGIILTLLLIGPCMAITPAPAVKPVAALSAPTTLPDYGGRDAPGLLTGVGVDAPNPLASAGRSVLALVVVLGGIVGVVKLLKRAGYTGSGPVGMALLSGLRASVPAAPKAEVIAEAAGPLTLLQSQTLPGGGTVSLLSIDGKTRVLIGSTPQSMTVLAVWDWEEADPGPDMSFYDHLRQAQSVPTPAIPRQLSDLLADISVRPTHHTPL